MKCLPIENPQHKRLESAFGEWLELTGYGESSIYNMPHCVREFFHWLESQNKFLERVSSSDIDAYFFHLSRRRKQRGRTGALRTGYLHKHLQALRQFSRYLRETGQPFFEAEIKLPEQSYQVKTVLTRSEISSLYEACDGSPLGLRDRAMLSVFYGCGLRRSEATGLDTGDVLTGKNLLYVRKGKNYRERYVPLTSDIRSDLEGYLYYGRPAHLKNPLEEAFFVSERGSRIQGQSLFMRLKKLLKKAGIDPDRTDQTGLHTLRHSIATHLLQGGMQLSQIARFLGHDSLESTQIYTHIAGKL